MIDAKKKEITSKLLKNLKAPVAKAEPKVDLVAIAKKLKSNKK